MRAWRKVYATILDSEQVSGLSDGASFLLTLLIVAQDDTGYWPWTPTKVRRLIACRPQWSIRTAEDYAKELVAVGIAVWADGGIVLLNGQGLNGTPRSDSKAEITPRIESATPCIELATPRNRPVFDPSRKDARTAADATDVERAQKADSSTASTQNAENQPDMSVCNESATPRIESATSRCEVVPLDKSRSRVDKSRSDLEESCAFAEPQKTPPKASSEPTKAKGQKAPKPPKSKETLEDVIAKYGEESTQRCLKEIEIAYKDPIPYYATQATHAAPLVKKYGWEVVLACWKFKSERKDGCWVDLYLVAKDIADYVAGRLYGQKGQSNGRNDTRGGRALPLVDGDNTEYYRSTEELQERQAEYRRKHGIGRAKPVEVSDLPF